jgi:hypothetical protein
VPGHVAESPPSVIPAKAGIHNNLGASILNKNFGSYQLKLEDLAECCSLKHVAQASGLQAAGGNQPQ